MLTVVGPPPGQRISTVDIRDLDDNPNLVLRLWLDDPFDQEDYGWGVENVLFNPTDTMTRMHYGLPLPKNWTV